MQSYQAYETNFSKIRKNHLKIDLNNNSMVYSFYLVKPPNFSISYQTLDEKEKLDQIPQLRNLKTKDEKLTIINSKISDKFKEVESNSFFELLKYLQENNWKLRIIRYNHRLAFVAVYHQVHPKTDEIPIQDLAVKGLYKAKIRSSHFSLNPNLDRSTDDMLSINPKTFYLDNKFGFIEAEEPGYLSDLIRKLFDFPPADFSEMLDIRGLKPLTDPLMEPFVCNLAGVEYTLVEGESLVALAMKEQFDEWCQRFLSGYAGRVLYVGTNELPFKEIDFKLLKTDYFKLLEKLPAGFDLTLFGKFLEVLVDVDNLTENLLLLIESAKSSTLSVSNLSKLRFDSLLEDKTQFNGFSGYDEEMNKILITFSHFENYTFLNPPDSDSSYETEIFRFPLLKFSHKSPIQSLFQLYTFIIFAKVKGILFDTLIIEDPLISNLLINRETFQLVKNLSPQTRFIIRAVNPRLHPINLPLLVLEPKLLSYPQNQWFINQFKRMYSGYYYKSPLSDKFQIVSFNHSKPLKQITNQDDELLLDELHEVDEQPITTENHEILLFIESELKGDNSIKITYSRLLEEYEATKIELQLLRELVPKKTFLGSAISKIEEMGKSTPLSLVLNEKGDEHALNRLISRGLVEKIRKGYTDVTEELIVTNQGREYIDMILGNIRSYRVDLNKFLSSEELIIDLSNKGLIPVELNITYFYVKSLLSLKYQLQSEDDLDSSLLSFIICWNKNTILDDASKFLRFILLELQSKVAIFFHRYIEQSTEIQDISSSNQPVNEDQIVLEPKIRENETTGDLKSSDSVISAKFEQDNHSPNSEFKMTLETPLIPFIKIDFRALPTLLIDESQQVDEKVLLDLLDRFALRYFINWRHEYSKLSLRQFLKIEASELEIEDRVLLKEIKELRSLRINKKSKGLLMKLKPLGRYILLSQGISIQSSLYPPNIGFKFNDSENNSILEILNRSGTPSKMIQDSVRFILSYWKLSEKSFRKQKSDYDQVMKILNLDETSVLPDSEFYISLLHQRMLDYQKIRGGMIVTDLVDFEIKNPVLNHVLIESSNKFLVKKLSLRGYNKILSQYQKAESSLEKRKILENCKEFLLAKFESVLKAKT